ncbi:MAG: M48 family metallopeptidase [Chloroflexi bacterium]|nr:M48 family metallopeptidase [Chloroflexota bacterium]MBM3182842.1 M48 family metallopeptidase [Chloroflexota bacterium]MBM4452018.1 M48 family metallopeptidase [Chloroflexota bacterium]MBM4453584.1 M48 family metallopeptidase [Chloroflexota bacterium]
MAGRGCPRPIIVTQGEVILDGETIPYVVKRSTRARNIRLEIRRGQGLVVVIPRMCPAERVTEVLKAKKRWILRNLAGQSQLYPQLREQGIKFGDVVSYLGRPLVVVAGRKRSAEYARLERNRLVVSGVSSGEQIGSVLEQWYRVQAAGLVAERVGKWGTELGVNPGKVTIRGQRTRWGSCSRKGNLSFNWKLVMAPEAVIDYVVIHELAHLKEMNHSRRFWRLVARHCPEYCQCKKWLRAHEAELASGLLARQIQLGI